MSKRSNWSEFDRETRKYIKARDNNECVICHTKKNLQIMHIFLSRAAGGKGIKENGCIGCIRCHQIIDNPIGYNQMELSQKYMKLCEEYLIKKENITDIKKLIKDLEFHKENIIINFKPEVEKQYDRCKNCKMLIKTKSKYSSLPAYYCRYKKIYLNKTTKACKFYKEK